MIKHITHSKRSFTKVSIYALLLLLLTGSAIAQDATDTVAEFKPHGQLWGCAFGDYAYKGNADILNRGGSNQYTGTPINTSLFQWRRIYLAYDYEISKHFSAQFTLSAENDYGAPFNAASGDLLANNKFAPFVKYANIRWKNIWHNSDLVIGQQNGPAYGKTGRDDQTTEEVWGYRSVERTISDIYGTPCYDMGASLQGWFDNRGNFGYNIMVGNGTMAKPETDQYKWFYGNVYAKFLDKRIVINLYQDYERLNWGVYVPGPKAGVPSLNGPWYHDRNMTKLFAAWNTKKLTVGVEAFRTTILGDIKVTGKDGSTYYRNTDAMAVSAYVRGRILSYRSGAAMLGFFVRFDNFDPTGDLSSIVGNANTKSYTATTAAYDPTTKQQFVLLGFDYTPIKNVHIMPNLWLNTYTSSLTQSTANDLLNPGITGIKGTDAVWRLTFYYIYGK